MDTFGTSSLLFVTPSLNTAARYGQSPVTQTWLTLSYTVPCGLFQDVCVPHTPNSCQCWLTFFHQTCIGSQLWTRCCPKQESHQDWPVHADVFNHPSPRLLSRHGHPIWSDFPPVGMNTKWKEDWQSALVTNHAIVVDPTSLCFDLLCCSWSLLNCFRTGQGPCKTSCASGGWHSHRTARVMSPRPWATLWTPAYKQSLKTGWQFYMMLKKMLSTGWILWWLQHSRNNNDSVEYSQR